jgi:succinoglycan biosynthesis protein ExoM
MNAPAATTIDIGVCTFRRPQLADTLRSLALLRLPEGLRIQVIVADNDDVPSARAIARELASELGLRLRYLHCPARNISLARNACLDASTADFLAFLDDDETVTPDWVARLVEAAERDRADVVLGPVRATYGPDAPAWMREGDFHSTSPVLVHGEIRTGYTCNALLRRSADSIAARRFSLARGRSGGEDTEFFDAVWRAGGRIAFAPEAWLEEPVPPARATFKWLARRRLRVGQTHGSLLGRVVGAYSIPGQVALALAKAVYSFAAAALFLAVSPVQRNRSALRGIMHLGVVGGLLGVREAQHYGNTAPEEGTGDASGFALLDHPGRVQPTERRGSG